MKEILDSEELTEGDELEVLLPSENNIAKNCERHKSVAEEEPMKSVFDVIKKMTFLPHATAQEWCKDKLRGIPFSPKLIRGGNLVSRTTENVSITVCMAEPREAAQT